MVILTSIPLLAVGLAEQVAGIAIKCLSVAGGFLAGYVFGALCAWAIDRWLLGKKTPESLQKAVRMCMGAVVALLIALMLFGEGSGGGLFGGTGDGEGKSGSNQGASSSKEKSDGTPTKLDTKGQSTRIDVTKSSEIKPNDTVIRITFLGADDVIGDGFYLIDDDKVGKTFVDVQKEVLRRKREADKSKVWLLFQFTKTNRVLDNTRNVTQIEDFANANGIGFSRSNE